MDLDGWKGVSKRVIAHAAGTLNFNLDDNAGLHTEWSML